MNQRGFATLEVILMIVVIGILATVAVPRFTDVTTKANTAKIQSDLTTIDTAIQIYYMEKGSLDSLTTVDQLKSAGYLMDTPTPPTGSAYVKATTTATTSTKSEIDATSYGIDTTNQRATLKMKDKDSATAGDFELPKSS